MANNIYDFRGEWYVWWAQGFEPVLQQGWMLILGMGDYGASEPSLSPSGEPCIGFAIREPTPKGGWTTYASSADSQPLVLRDGQLRWDSKDEEDHPLRIYISVAEAVTLDERIYRSLYGSTLHGDPDQVAVWGANDSPPP